MDDCDLVFCGDFNSTRWNAPWHYLYCGRLEAGYTEPFYPDIEVVKQSTAHPFALQDVYKTAGAIPEFTARAPRRRSEADFIFASRHLKVAGVLRAIDPRMTPYVDRTFLPNKFFPSDHIPLGVVLLQPRLSDLRSHRSIRHYSEDLDSSNSFACGSVSSDKANNIEPHPSLESLDSSAPIIMGMTTQLPRNFLDDTALA